MMLLLLVVVIVIVLGRNNGKLADGQTEIFLEKQTPCNQPVKKRGHWQGTNVRNWKEHLLYCGEKQTRIRTFTIFRIFRIAVRIGVSWDWYWVDAIGAVDTGGGMLMLQYAQSNQGVCRCPYNFDKISYVPPLSSKVSTGKSCWASAMAFKPSLVAAPSRLELRHGQVLIVNRYISPMWPMLCVLRRGMVIVASVTSKPAMVG